MAEVITETCGNCGRVIGRLETPVLWEEHVVCGECYRRLNTPVPQPKTPTDPLQQLSQAVHAPARRIHPRREFQDYLKFSRAFFLWPALVLAVLMVTGGMMDTNKSDEPRPVFSILFANDAVAWIVGVLLFIWFILKIVSMIQRAAWLQKVDDGF